METAVTHNGKVYIWRGIPHRVEVGAVYDENGKTICGVVRIFWGDNHVVFHTHEYASVGDYNMYEAHAIVEGALPDKEGVVCFYANVCE